MSDLLETQGMTDLQAVQTAEPSINQRERRNNKLHQHKPKRLVGDLESMGGHVYCTAEENKGRYLSHKDITRMLKGQASRHIRKGQSDFRKMWDGEADAENAIPDPDIPDSLLTNTPSTIDRLAYSEKTKMVLSRREDFNNNLSLAWDLIWGQCTLKLRNKLVLDEGFQGALEDADCVWLLRKTRHYMYFSLTESYEVMGIVQSEKDLFNFKQGRRTLHEYAEAFKEVAETAEYSNGSIGVCESLVKFVEKNYTLEVSRPRVVKLPDVGDRPPSVDQLQLYLTQIDDYKRKVERYERRKEAYEENVNKIAKDMYLETLFMMNADADQYKGLMKHWETEYLGGKNSYLTSLQDAINRLETYRKTHRPKQKQGGKNRKAPHVAFLQSAAPVPGTDGKIHSKIDCHKCGQYGHYAPQCPNGPSSAVSKPIMPRVS